MRYPLIDGQGNFGNIDGDGAAAMRYTEAKLTKVSTSMLNDINKDVVDMKLNFSEDEEEPMVLPALFPNLLANGTIGIGVAMACSFAPHNLNELCSAIVAQIKNSEISIEDLCGYIKGPDFPTGGTIINKSELINAYKTGKGRVRVRAKYEVEKINKRDGLVFYEIPFGVSKEKIIKSIVDCSDGDNKKIEGIANVQDQSNKLGIRIEVELKKDVNPDVIANQLFKHTKLEDTFSINQVCLVEREPKLLNLKEIIAKYISHQEEVFTRKFTFDLKKIEARLHLLNGLLIALEDIDNVIVLIKSASNAQDAIIKLEDKYSIDEIQAKAIVEMKLRKLTGLEKIELENEKQELVEKSKEINSILSNKNKLDEVIINEINNLKKEFGDERRTDITQISLDNSEKDIQYVQPEDVVVVVTKAGEIKKIPAKNFKVQNRNGKGIKNQTDLILDVIKTNTVDSLMVFTSLGKMYKIIVDQIPNGTNSSRGISISSLVKMESHDSVMAITSMKRKTSAKFVVSITEQGMVKKTKIEEYEKTKRNGISAVGLKENDKLSTITFLESEQLLLLTEQGMSIRFNTDDIAPIGRTAIGVRGIKLSEGDRVIKALPINKETDELSIFTTYGFGRRTSLVEFPLQKRDGKGVIAYKISNTGTVVDAVLVEDKDNLLLVGDKTSICISAKEVPSLMKSSMGNIMIKDNILMSVTKI